MNFSKDKEDILPLEGYYAIHWFRNILILNAPQPLTLFGIDGGSTPASYQFSPCYFYKRKTYPHKTFWILVLNLFPLSREILKPNQLQILTYWTRTNTTPQEKWFFWSKLYKIELIIHSLIEMLELPDFAHMRKPTI